MSNFNYINPISPNQLVGLQSVSRTKTVGTNFSVLQTGGFMEVYSVSQLYYTVPSLTYGPIQYTGNTIPITFSKGSGTTFSFDTLTLNSDNISSGRKKLGMLVHVINEDQIYQFSIDNFETLWNAATGATGVGGPTVVVSTFGTLVKANSPEGIAFISGWTANTIEGVSGVTRSNAVWKKYWGNNLSITGGTFDSFTGTLNLVNITGGTVPITGISGGGGGGSITGGTITYTGYEGTLNLSSSAGTISITGLTDVYTTGGTYSAGTATFTNNTGGTFNVTGFSDFHYYISGSSPSGITLSIGDRWYNTNTGAEYVWNYDGNTYQWVQPAGTPGPRGLPGYSDVMVTTAITVSAETLITDYTYYGVVHTNIVNLTLPNPTGIDGVNLTIKDESGNASIYRIRLTSPVGNIDNQNYVDMNLNNMSLHLVVRNNNWWII